MRTGKPITEQGEALATVVLDSIRDVPHYLLRVKNKVASVTLLTAHSFLINEYQYKRMNRKLTILDIARLSGVGKSTVSRVLTNDPKVKPETRAKVEQVIAESGYVPSKSAQTMRGGSQKVVGIIISRLDSPSETKRSALCCKLSMLTATMW